MKSPTASVLSCPLRDLRVPGALHGICFQGFFTAKNAIKLQGAPRILQIRNTYPPDIPASEPAVSHDILVFYSVGLLHLH